LRARALAALKDVAFLPERARNRLESMVATRPDWCVSRQRTWGVPLGLFTHRDTGAVLEDGDVLERVRTAFAEEGADAWFTRPAAWFLGAGRDPAEWTQCQDVLDVWFESGATHGWVLPSRHGARVSDLCVEGSDQHRGWFQSSLLTAAAVQGRAPYRALVTHGFVLDERGRKMSKSEGNVVDPLELCGRAGADAVRLWVASTDTASDMRYSEKALDTHRQTLRRFRNTLRWLLGNLAAAPFERLPLSGMEVPERWMLARLNGVGRELGGQARQHDFGGMAGTLNRFCADDLSAVWFDMRKDALYCDHPASVRRRGVATVAAHVAEHLTLWLAPLVPFTAEEAWLEAHGAVAGSVHERKWPEAREEWDDADLLRRWAAVRGLRNTCLAAAEREQQSGRLKSLLETDARLELPASLHADMDGVDLAALLGMSTVTTAVGGASPEVTLAAARGTKCVRCWRVLPEVDNGLCRRCAAV
jgi:isoleucyl-tRNA synthetase